MATMPGSAAQDPRRSTPLTAFSGEKRRDDSDERKWPLRRTLWFVAALGGVLWLAIIAGILRVASGW